jgi:hypothetical protein
VPRKPAQSGVHFGLQGRSSTGIFHTRVAVPNVEVLKMLATPADYAIALFAATNIARAVAYIPQIKRVWRDRHGAAAVSILTWTLFVAANTATVFYSLAVSGDTLIALVFSFNALGCALIVGLTASKRWSAARE